MDAIELDEIGAPPYPFGNQPVVFGFMYRCRPCDIESAEGICFLCHRPTEQMD